MGILKYAALIVSHVAVKNKSASYLFGEMNAIKSLIGMLEFEPETESDEVIDSKQASVIALYSLSREVPDNIKKMMV